MKMWILQCENELEWPEGERPITFMGQTLLLRPQQTRQRRTSVWHTKDPIQTRGLSNAFFRSSPHCHGGTVAQREFDCKSHALPNRGGKGIFAPALRKDYSVAGCSIAI